MSYIKDISVIQNTDSTVTLEGNIPFAKLQDHRSAAITHLGKDITVDGFRKGSVPEQILVERIGEMNILSEMAERALASSYPDMLKTHAIDAIGYPQVAITKLAPDNDLGFKITVATVPKLTLPDYKKIAAAHSPSTDKAEVTDEDIQNAVDDILRRKVAYDRLQAKAAAKAASENGDLPTPESVEASSDSDEDAPLPELTDELVATLGNFDSVAAFKDHIKKELTEQKEQEAKNKHRATITDALIEATDVTIPEVMIQAELEQFMAQMKDDLNRAQLSFEEYLSHIKKTEEELKNEWRPSAEKRAKVQILLDAVADNETIEPDTEVINNQVQALTAQYPDADSERIHTYVRTILRNEAVMKLLTGDDASANTQEESSST